MLSRVANTLYWMVRYVERADNLARLIDVNQQLLLDSERLDSERLQVLWRPIILSTGDEERFDSIFSQAGSREVIQYLTDHAENPNSIVSCITIARENARTVRDQLSDDLWEELNGLYLFLRSDKAQQLLADDTPRFYSNIRRSAVAFLGITASTVIRDEGWEFMNLGRHLERADKTTRFLDIASYLPEAVNNGPVLPHWSAILRSCGALGAYRTENRGEINAENVVEFLMFSRRFPRSVRFCIDRVDMALHQISGTSAGDFANEVERESGRLLAELNFGTTEDAFAIGLHEYLDQIQKRLNKIGSEMFETYVLLPEREHHRPEPKPSGISARAIWQQEQEQQQ